MSPFKFTPTSQPSIPPSSPLDHISSSKESDPRAALGWTILGILSCLGGLTLFLSLAFYSPLQKMDLPLDFISSIIIGIGIAFQLAVRGIPSLTARWIKFKDFIKKANRLYYFMQGVGLTFLLIICVAMGGSMYRLY